MNEPLTERRQGMALVLLAMISLLFPMSVAHAHTEPDLVAIAAGENATLVFRPTHGCGDAATIEVAIRAPVADAVAGSVVGWEEMSTPDGPGHTILTWTGGILPSDTTGEFPMSFRVPDAVGELLVFPAVQICENTEELAWIDGDPEGAYPAPRILILPPGFESAATIDAVPPDAPGRDQLVQIVDVDNPSPTTTSTPTTTTTSTTSTSTTTTPATAPTTSAPAVDTPAATDQTDDDGGTGGVVAGAAVAAIIGAAAVVALRRRSR
jgi:uncharacterized protein YcnI